MIELETGDPWKKDSKPASSSRFLLPFSYTLNPANAAAVQADQLCFRQVQPKKDFERERLLYFTAETANVLFQRAIWAEIDASAWQNAGLSGPFLFHSVERDNRTFSVCLAPPQLVLFEGQADNRTAHPPLRHGFLIQDVFFPEADPAHRPPSLDDLLEFNELFRYIDRPFPGHLDGFFAKALKNFPADYSTGGETIGAALKAATGTAENNRSFVCYKKRWLSLLYNVPLRMYDGQYLLPVPPTNISCERHQLLDNHLACTSNNCLLYADNRAFVWTAAIVKGGGSSLAEQYDGKVDQPSEFGHWCKLLNVDKPDKTPEGSHVISAFEKKWTEERTYQRWAEYGTWYGYSYHSGAMLAGALSEPPLWRYFGEMYFDQVLLLFYLRITLFAFSRELTRMNQGDSEQRDAFNLLRASFAKFTNLYQFPLISNQQQGLEMYKVARKSMDIDELFKEVQEEISSTHEFLEMKANRRLGKIANIIAILAAVAAFGSLLSEDLRKGVFTFLAVDKSRGVLLFLVFLFAPFLGKPISRLWRPLIKRISEIRRKML
ncbi:MAG: hypothetical protein QTN59_10030 [Candidatus Electrothrix communis]|nr:MAG: hypothetical protein QTN59_10030 [Candidatus Electrothrix communis]